MTFREYMIQKLEGLDPPPKKKETKYSTIFYIPRKYSCGFYEIKIPNPGTKFYKHLMIEAMTKFSCHFPSGRRTLIESLAKTILEKEEQEANEK